MLFYDKLYSSQQTSTNALNNDFGNFHLENKLSPNDSKTCEGKLTVDDCYNAIINMKLNKSPASEGLPVEFYKTFWPKIEYLVVDSLNEGCDSGEFSSLQRNGLIKLIYKRDGKLSLNNWRPISLLITDFSFIGTCAQIPKNTS